MKKLVSGLLLGLFLSTPALAQDGLYIGASLGNSIIQDTIVDQNQIEQFDFDENAGGYKGTLGLRLSSLAVEASYHNFGDPNTDNATGNTQIEVSGVDISALYNFSIGPIDIFGKAGYFWWDSQREQLGLRGLKKDGSDPLFGAGAAFNLGSLAVRGEVEMFNVGDVDDLYFISVGLTHTF